MILLPAEGGKDKLLLHTSFAMDDDKLLIRTDNSIVTNDIPLLQGWTGLVITYKLYSV